MVKSRSKLALAALFTFVLCSGFLCTGSQIHKATLAEHDFKVAVQGFQNAEIAEYQSGRISQAVHTELETYIGQVADGGAALTTLIQKGDKAGALAQISAIDGAIQTLLNKGVLGIKNPTTVANLEIALEAVQGVVTQIQVALS